MSHGDVTAADNSDTAPADDEPETLPTRRILLWISFDGAEFHGFQQQTGLRTVAGTLEQMWFAFRGEHVTVRSSSRTDARVHARHMPAIFETTDALPLKGIRFGLEHRLPADLAITGAEEVTDDFHVRHDAIGKRYVYRLWSGRARCPTRRRDHWHVPWQLDTDAMSEAARHFEGEHDFAGFRTTACSAQTTLRSLSHVRVVTDAGGLSVEGERAIAIVVEGNAFLHNMVRIIAGTLVEVGKGRIPATELPSIIASQERSRAGTTAPGHGLTLEAVFYGPYGARQGLEHKQLLARLHDASPDP
ncbi:MAG: tRNA pseudouridine(38-40) synthase TruA [Myxococcales bacterium]|nr:tRNA pseudouridine(38-40) synthase TruA [Myxococcales bacterium]